MSFWYSSHRSKLSGYSDEKLAEYFFATRNRQAAEEIFSRYIHLLFGVCMKFLKDEETAKDAVMQVFEIAIAHKPDKLIENFKGWLYIVTRNHCLMLLRKNQMEIRYLNENEKELSREFMESSVPDSLTNDDHDKPDLNLYPALDRLPEEQKKCIELFYLEKKSYEEIMQQTNYTYNQVKSYIQNGKRNLKNLMNNEK
jgi:RNA polymerase sigma-70 factor (ECF subfamily)